jgi:hypothetical protein
LEFVHCVSTDYAQVLRFVNVFTDMRVLVVIFQ